MCLWINRREIYFMLKLGVTKSRRFWFYHTIVFLTVASYKQPSADSESDVPAACQWDTLRLSSPFENTGMSRQVLQVLSSTSVGFILSGAGGGGSKLKFPNNHADTSVMIFSIAGHYDLSAPGFHMYSASKHAVTALTEGLRKELVSQNSKIRVTVSATHQVPAVREACRIRFWAPPIAMCSISATDLLKSHFNASQSYLHFGLQSNHFPRL